MNRARPAVVALGLMIAALAFGDDIGTRARFGSPPVPVAGAGQGGTLTSTAGNFVLDAGVVVVGGVTATGTVQGNIVQGSGSNSTGTVRLFDSTDNKTWYFINNNNRLQLYGNNGSTVVFDVTGDTGEIGNLVSTKNRGSCTLVSASPSTCTATVTASSICVCAPVGTTTAIAAAWCAVSLSGTTLTITGPNTVTTVINYHCF